MSSIVATLEVGSQLPPPAPTIPQWLGLVGNMYTACQSLVDGLRSSGILDEMPLKLLTQAIKGCKNYVTFLNDIYNDTGLIPPLDPLMQVQKPTE